MIKLKCEVKKGNRKGRVKDILKKKLLEPGDLTLLPETTSRSSLYS